MLLRRAAKIPALSAGGAVQGYFTTPIFHPNVAKNGEICVNTLKKDWKADCKLRSRAVPDPALSPRHPRSLPSPRARACGCRDAWLTCERDGGSHILMVVRCLLIEPNPESALNEEAGRMFMEDYEEYSKRARLMTKIHAVAADGAGGDAAVKAAGDGEKGRPEKLCKTDKGSKGGKDDKKAVEKKKALKRL
jgi:ubiquitin-conjugating enzyme E2 S